MATSTDAGETVEFLGALKYNQLRSLAKSRGLNSKGKKADLISRLCANNAEANVSNDAEYTVNMDQTDTDNHRENATTPTAARSARETCERHERESEIGSNNAPEHAITPTVNTTPATCERRNKEGKADAIKLLEHATTPAEESSTPATCERRKRECFAPQATTSSEAAEGDPNGQDSGTEVNTSEEAMIASADDCNPHRSERFSQKDAAASGDTPSRAKPSASVTECFRPESTQKRQNQKTKATPSSRFARAHQNLFAGQRSIEAYGRTPKKSGIAKENMLHARVASKSTAIPKPIARTLASTSAYGVGSSAGSGVKQAKDGNTVASKPCTLVIQPSTRKPTQVKAFSLSSAKGKREGFMFKPYSGRLQPVAPVVGALADRTSNTNVPPTASSKGKTNPRDRVGVKATLASGKAQVNRRAARTTAGKTQREKKLAERRAGAA